MTGSRITAAVGAMLLHPAVAGAQCVMCRAALDGLDEKLAAAFRSGVLFLFAAPFAVFSTVAVLAVRDARRRARAGSRL